MEIYSAFLTITLIRCKPSAFTIGHDIGSSVVKASLLEVENGRTTVTITWSETEMAIDALKPGWTEEPGIFCQYSGDLPWRDQPNNAFSQNIPQPGEIAATAGTG